MTRNDTDRRPSEPAVGDGPLHGIRVLDLTRVLSGPICGRALSDLGADVVKVEPPAGDLTRFATPRRGAISGYFAEQNAGKRNISIDLTTKRGREVLAELAAVADVFLENFRPGVCERWNLSYDDLATTNPGLVYASLTGYGQTGPWAGRQAYAAVIHAEAGYTARTHGHQHATEGRSALTDDSLSHGDVYAGLLTLSGILSALHERNRSGRGQHIDVAMLDAMVFVNEHVNADLAPDDTSGTVPSLGAGWGIVVTSSDDTCLTIAGDPTMNGTFERYAAMTERRDWLTDAGLSTVAGRVDAMASLRGDVRSWASTRDASAVIASAESVGLAVGRARTIEELAELPHVIERGTFVDVDDRRGGHWTIPQSPWRFGRTPAGVRGGPTWRGEHNRQVLTDWLGFDDDAIGALEHSGVLSARPPRS